MAESALETTLPASPRPRFLERLCVRVTAFDAHYLRDAHGRRDWLQIALALATLAAFVASLAVLSTAFAHPLINHHGFRQTQTAISVYSMLNGGDWLFYETPVMGAPWKIPFEAPVYHITVGLIALATPLGIEVSGVIASYLYLMGALIVGLKLVHLLAPHDRRIGFLFALLFLASPQYMFWGRTFMIETCALFYCALFLYAAIRFHLKPSIGLFGLAFAASLLGAFAKATTWPAFAAAFALFWLVDVYRERRLRIAPSIGVAILGAATIAAVMIWNHAADTLKAQNAFGLHLTGANLSRWNFGTLEQRIGSLFWANNLPKRMLPESLGAFWPVIVIALTHLVRLNTNAMLAIAGVVLFFLPLMLFTNLHIVHDYYQTANGVFLIVSAAAILAGVMNAGRARLAAFLLAILVAGQANNFLDKRWATTRRDLSEIPTSIAARAAREMTTEGTSIFVFGDQWSSVVHYYAQRSGIAFPTWIPTGTLKDALDDPEKFVGDRPFRGAVDCRDVRSNKYNEEQLTLIDAFIARLIDGGAETKQAAGCRILSIAP